MAESVIPNEEKKEKVSGIAKLQVSQCPDKLTTVDPIIFGSHNKLCDYTCPKCDQVPLNPVCLRCGCSFCEMCFEKIRDLERCSACSVEIMRGEDKKIITAPAYPISGKLKALEVDCLHKDIGCLEKMRFGDNGKILIEHLHKCKFALVECPNCSSIMSKAKLALHKPTEEASCPDSTHTCILCESKHRLRDMPSHKESRGHIQVSMEYTEIFAKIICGMYGKNVERNFLLDKTIDVQQIYDANNNFEEEIYVLKFDMTTVTRKFTEQQALIKEMQLKIDKFEEREMKIEAMQKKIDELMLKMDSKI